MTAIGLAALLAAAQTIDTVVVVNRNVFDRADDAPGFVARVANALHIPTRPSVIRRTLLLGAGDPYDSARVVESERALRALDVFRFVRVDTVRLAQGRLALRVVTADGWSSKPQWSYSSTGGDQTWEVGFVEQNFLGMASELGVAYGRTPDRRRLEFQYLSRHLLVRRAAVLLRYGDFSDGRRGVWQAGVPFYETAARWALETYGESARERVLRFKSGALVDSTQRRAVRAGVSAGFAPVATTRDYVRVLVGAEWLREDFAPETTTVWPRSTFPSARAAIEIGHARFRVVEHLNSFARREDVDLSPMVRVGLVAESGVGFEARTRLSTVWHRGFAVLRGEASGRDTSRVRGRVTFVSQNLPGQTFIAHVEGGALHRPRPGTEFDLWTEQRGPRLFGAHAFSGTRMAWVALEDRVLVADDVWGLMAFGLAAFVDYGGAWYTDEATRLGGNVGVALRFGPTRSIRGEAGELAIGYRFGDGVAGKRWALTLRRGVVF